MTALLPPRTCLEPTPLGTTAPVLALVREGMTLASLCRTLTNAAPRPQAVLVDGPTPREWLDAIVETGCEVWLIVRTVPDVKLQAWLVAHKQQVRVMVAFLPGSPKSSELLGYVADLQGESIRVQVSIEPLIAGTTDTRAVLGELLAALAQRGLRQVTLGYLALDAATESWLQRTQGEGAHSLLAQYREGPVAHIPGRGRVRLLPRTRRQRGYAGLLNLAAEHGLTVCISPLANPDFDRPRPAPPRETPLPRLADAYHAAGQPRRAGALL